MRYAARLACLLYLVSFVALWSQEKKGNMTADSVTLKPVVSEKQKLKIRTQQVAVYQAKEVLESTPQFRAFMQSQNKMNEISLQVQRDIGCIPPKWQFTQDLDCIPIPPPEKK